MCNYRKVQHSTQACVEDVHDIVPSPEEESESSSITSCESHDVEEHHNCNVMDNDNDLIRHENKVWKCPYKIIPQFYFPGKRNCAFNQPNPMYKLTKSKQQFIHNQFSKFTNHCMPKDIFAIVITSDFLRLPSYCNELLIRRITEHYQSIQQPQPSLTTTTSSPSSSDKSHDSDTSITDCEIDLLQSITPTSYDTISYESFIQYWKDEILPYDNIEQFYRLLKQPTNNSIYLLPNDFIPLIQSVVNNHPDLSPMHTISQQYVNKYILTVITRIFYLINTSRTGKISLREFRNTTSSLLTALYQIDHINNNDNDINNETNYFSYEHFFILFSTFLELDKDNDEILHIKDIQLYQDYALTPIMVNR